MSRKLRIQLGLLWVMTGLSFLLAMPWGRALAQQTLQTIQPVVQSAANWTMNIVQFGGVNLSNGIGPAGTGIPRVTDSRDNLNGSVAITTSTATVACAAASATAITSNSSCISVPLAGFAGAQFQVQVGTLAATLQFENSIDGGATWNAAFAVIANTLAFQATNFTYTNPNALQDGTFIVGGGWTHVRVRCSAFTSGTATVVLSATQLISPLAVGALQIGVPGFVPPVFSAFNSIRATSTVPTVVGSTALVAIAGDLYGVQFARVDHPNRIKCTLTTTATTSTSLGGSCVAPGAGTSIYVTDLSVYGGVANAITAASTIQSGTGGTCGTATVILHYCQHGATAGCEAHFLMPLKTAAINEICLLDAATGTKFATLSGFIAP